MAKRAASRRIKSAKITHLSLCKRGANEQPVLLKSEGRVEFATLVKDNMKEGLLTALVYVPDRADSEGDVASREVIKQMAHDFIANGAQVDIEHNLKSLPVEKVRVAENFIVEKGDPRFQGWKDYDGQPVDTAGAWAVVLKIEDPELRRLYVEGNWNGVSMYGLAEVQPLTKQETRMDLAQLQAALAANNAALIEGLAKALKPEAPKPATPTNTQVEFEGDFMNQEDVSRHAEKVLFKSLDLNKPADLKRWTDHLTAKAAKAQPKTETEKQIEALNAEIRKLQGASAQPVGKTDEQVEETTEIVGMSKSESAQFEAGKKRGKAWSERSAVKA